ncbi:hypothetical protein EGT07_23860 [Herbaspirillum sp. HC18]|nr:hypothetical protein EGT07_23860 [Herbaspirillum sp. HC18]
MKKMRADQIAPLTHDQSVRLAAVKIREAVKLGPDKTSASSTELVMIAFATCDRQRWLPGSNEGSTELWARLDRVQREAIALYLNGK